MSGLYRGLSLSESERIELHARHTNELYVNSYNRVDLLFVLEKKCVPTHVYARKYIHSTQKEVTAVKANGVEKVWL